MWPWVELKDLKALLIHPCNDIIVNYRVCGHRLVGANWPQNENVNVMLLYHNFSLAYTIHGTFVTMFSYLVCGLFEKRK